MTAENDTDYFSMLYPLDEAQETELRFPFEYYARKGIRGVSAVHTEPRKQFTATSYMGLLFELRHASDPRRH